MIAPVLLSLLCFCCGLVVSQAAPSVDWSRWGKVRPPRVLEINDTINVHVVPHTHDDVGWLKTVDEYYYGANNSIQHAAVQYILDTVIEQLLVDKGRTFIYVEIAFFTRWWNEQTAATKETVKTLVKNKQLEFANAGWCMNDEGSTHYNAIIDQMSLGLKFVEDTFGEDARPRVAWQIDTFGHSSEMAAIYSMMGFDGLFFARNDYDDKNQRLKDNTMEMVWRPSPSLGNISDLFTGILLFHYGPPPGFCFDLLCADPPIKDDPSLFDYNVDERVDTFIEDILLAAGNYRTNNIMFTFGSDFQYESAIENYKNIDKLMEYTMQKEPRIKVFYSTPSRYLDAVHQTGLSWTVKEDDFFPYASGPWAYWTGYFTSRPALKGYARKLNSLLQVCKQLEVLGEPLSKARKTTATSAQLQEALAVNQHHDAISGTEKQHVAYDYAKRLHIGQVECETLIQDVAGAFIAEKSDSPAPDFQSCEYLNVSICPATEQGNFNALIYNPIGRSRDIFMRFPINSPQVSVTDDLGQSVMAQVVKVTKATSQARTGLSGSAPYELVIGDSLPALGFKTYFVRVSTNESTMKGIKVTELSPTKTYPQSVKEDIPIENEAIQVVFDSKTKRVKSITNKLSAVSVSVDQGFYWYNSSAGNNINSTQTSGAYVFRPNGTKPFDVSPNGVVDDLTITQGDLFVEATQTFSSWVYQSVRIFNNLPIVEFEFTIGPIPIKDHLGKEIVSQFTTDLDNSMTWYTDANGREMQKRIRNFRPTWKLNETSPVAENFYPVTSCIFMKDESKKVQFTVLNDRSQGGASLNDGQMEIMVHRRTTAYGGPGEALNEPGLDGKGLIVRGRHIVLLDNFVNSTVYHRTIGEMLMMNPQSIFAKDTSSPSDYMKYYFTNFTGLTRELPLNVHLLTLQFLEDGKYLLRLEHQFEMDETPWNEPATLSLSDLFVFEITSVRELALGGNTEAPVTRLKWTTDVGPKSHRPSSIGEPVLGPKFALTIYPMEIRTFEVSAKYS